MPHPNANNPSYHAYTLLHWTFVFLPIVAGVDKFFHALTDWTMYLSPMIARTIDAGVFMKIAGVIEIVAGIVAIKNPRLAGFVISAWLGAIILNLLSVPGFYDIALRDGALAMCALALAHLSKEHVVTLKK
jgi:hypothetical protein